MTPEDKLSMFKKLIGYGEQKLPQITQAAEENLSGLTKYFRNPENVEVVNDIVVSKAPKVLPDIEAQLVKQGPKLLPEAETAVARTVPMITNAVEEAAPTILKTVDDIAPKIAQKSNMIRNIALGTAGLGGAAYLMSGNDESGKQEIPVTPKTKSIVKEEPKAQQEVAKSPTTGKKSVVDNALQNKAPEIAPVSSEKDSFNEMLENARQQDARSSLLFGLLKAAQTGSSAASGTKADTTFADSMLGKSNEMVNRLRSDEELKQEKKKFLDQDTLRDPNSSASQQARDIARKVGLKISDQTTAKELADAGLPIGTLLSNKMTIDARKEDAKLKREMLEIAKNEKKEQKESESAGKHIDTYNKMLYKDYQSLQQAETNAKRAKDIVANNIAGVTPGAGDIAILYNFVKGLDKNSAVREGEIALSKQARSVLGRLESEVKRIQGGNLLDDETRAAFAELIDASAKAEEANFIKQKKNAIAAGVQKGISPETLDKGIFADISTVQVPQAKQTTISEGKKTLGLPSVQKPGTVINQKSSGRKFRVNADGTTATEI